MSRAVWSSARGHLRRGLSALTAGAAITVVQAAVLYLSNNVALLLLRGPTVGWSLAAWNLGTWKRTKVWHAAWPPSRPVRQARM